ncbi:MAG: hypothetical protein RBQ81_05740 [Arcobacteraceae bacterium]|jgi:high-affinity nickel permease|nr:hypothetical protein [Arcobacteraceae bacterium]
MIKIETKENKVINVEFNGTAQELFFEIAVIIKSVSVKLSVDELELINFLRDTLELEEMKSEELKWIP